MNDNNNILEIKDLSVIYKTDLETVKAVNGINIAIKRRSTFGLVGETGAGKTTTARSIIRLLPAVGHVTSGSITFDDKDILNMPEEEMRQYRGDKIAMVFQDPMTSLNPVMSVGDQIAETIKIHNPHLSKEEVEQRVENTLQMVGILPSRKVEYPHQFSGGMKQRVIIAIALVLNPKILLADEPTTALDVTIQAQVLDTIQALRKKLDMSMILITHDLGIVAQTCEQVAIIYGGEVVEYADVFTIFENRTHPYTQGLFNSIPKLNEDVNRLVPIEGLMPDPTNLPTGCKFCTRCQHATDRCREEHPEMIDVGNGHLVRCFRAENTNAGGEQK